MAEAKAAQIDLERQKTLNLIAKQEAERRETEGTGISKFLAGLPKGIEHEQAVRLLLASASMEKAKAIAQAVQDGKISLIYIADSGDVSVPASPTKR